MDAATKVKLAGALYVGLIPTATVVAVGLAATWKSGREARRPLFAGLALIGGLAAAYLGSAGWDANESHRWVLYGVLLGGGLGLGLERAPDPWGRRLAPVLGAGVLSLIAWQLLAPLEGVWMEGGAVVQLAQGQWGLEPVVWGTVVWAIVTRAAADAPAPATLAPLALAFAGAAVVTGLSGSIKMAQVLGAGGVATAALGFLAWSRPALTPSLGALGAALTAFVALVIYGHFYVEVPRPSLGLILAAPAAAIAGTAAGPTWRRVALVLGLAALPVGTGVWLAWKADQAAQAAEAEDESPDYGSYY